MNTTLHRLRAELAALGTPEKAKASAWFFKTGLGQYGEGDRFIGVTVPQQRALAKRYRDLPLGDTEQLLMSPTHEERLTSLFILVGQYQKARPDEKKEIASFYHKHRQYVNNWDLVDSSASYIMGDYLINHSRAVLARLAQSKSIWDRRIAIIATMSFIRLGDPEWTFKIADMLMGDKQDLIHKAVGWALRDVGKYCSRDVLEDYLKTRYRTMPRTMLRYAIEHFPRERRQQYLKGLIE